MNRRPAWPPAALMGVLAACAALITSAPSNAAELARRAAMARDTPGQDAGRAAPEPDKVISRWFTGGLSALPDDEKDALVRLARRTAGGVRALTSEIYKGRLYLEILLNTDPEGPERPAGAGGVGRPGGKDEHANDGAAVQVDRLAAVSTLARVRLIPVLTDYAAVLTTPADIHGVKLFLIELPANAFIQLYAPLQAIHAFRRGAITRQQLMDQCAIQINNTPVRLDMR
jgi:hypothetical protein